jgi:hypothetical protein
MPTVRTGSIPPVRRCDVISAWLRQNLTRMNHVTLREAVKYLPDGDQIVDGWRRNKVG